MKQPTHIRNRFQILSGLAAQEGIKVHRPAPRRSETALFSIRSRKTPAAGKSASDSGRPRQRLRSAGARAIDPVGPFVQRTGERRALLCRPIPETLVVKDSIVHDTSEPLLVAFRSTHPTSAISMTTPSPEWNRVLCCNRDTDDYSA